MWGCDWEDEKRTNVEIQNYLKTVKHDEFLDPRQALAGGRTNAVTLYHRVKPGERMDYYDICSLV